MAIEPSIALGVKPLQLDDPLAQYGKIAAIQNAQNQNALAQYQLGAAQRTEAKDIARTNALAQAGTNNAAIANALLKAGDLAGYTSFIKSTREAQKADVDLIDAKLKQSRAFLEGIDASDPNAANQYIQWHRANHADPILGPALTAYGITPESSMGRIEKALAKGPQGLAALIAESKLGTDKFMELNKGQLSTKDTGSVIEDRVYNPLTGQLTTIGTTQKTATPGEKMVDARARERLLAEMESGNYSPETIKYLASIYNQTGQLPSLGIGKKAGAVKMQILDEARRLGTQAPSGGEAPTPEQAGENVVRAKQTRAAEQSTLRAFSAGMEGRNVRSFNTAINHLDTMDKLATALDNGDIRAFNAASTAFSKETGKSAPTNFDAAKAIVGGEVAKALTGSNMALKDREEIRDAIARSNSPAQLKGVIQTLQELMGGQLSSLKQQYEVGTNRKDFDTRLSGRAKQVIAGMETPGEAAPAPAKPITGADQQALDWATANPNDPRAAEIKRRLGVR